MKTCSDVRDEGKNMTLAQRASKNDASGFIDIPRLEAVFGAVEPLSSIQGTFLVTNLPFLNC